MSDGWYELVSPSTRLTQGDLIFECPISRWAKEPSPERGAEAIDGAANVSPLVDVLKKRLEIIAEDVIVMTQACDLEHGKVSDVVVCPHYALSYFRDEIWRPYQQQRGQKSNKEAWEKHFKAIAAGYFWNFCALNASGIEGNAMEHRFVDFHAIYTVPRDFLETLIQERNIPRLRLLPPYREHLSQAFARFFMRVGLPISLDSI